jgi:hypothetical protein
MFFSPAFSLCTIVELKLSLRTRLAPSMSDACETHAQPVEKFIASLAPSALLTFRPNDLLTLPLTALMIKFAILSARRGLQALSQRPF